MNIRGTHIIKVLFTSCCLIVSTAQIILAQESQFRFEHLQLPGGDRANFVGGIAEDSFGFMWFITWNGLYRYDGYSFTNYTHDPEDSTTLSANWVEAVYVDNESTLWAGTYGGGLNRFNPETETFTRFRNDPDNSTSISQDSVTVIMEDHLGHLWVGTMGGLNRMDRETGSFTHYTYDSVDSSSLSNNQVRAIYEDNQGALWIGTNSPFGSERDNPGPGGLNQFNRETETFTRYLHNPYDQNSLVSNHVMSIFEDSGGTFWVGTWENGLHTMDRELGTFTRHPYDPNAPDILSPPFSAIQTEAEGGVRFIQEDDQGGIWIGSFGIGLNRYDPETDTLIRFESNPDDTSSLSSNNVWSMYQSRDGTQWISMIPGGLNKIHLTQRPFEHFTLTPMHSNSFINVLDADNSGILRANVCCPENTMVSFKLGENENSSYRAISTLTIPEVWITAIENSEDGTLWFGSHEGTQTARYGGLYQMDEENDEIIPVLIDSTNSGTQIGPILDIHEDREGILWFGTRWTGLFRMNRETGEVRHYTHDPQNSTSLSHTNVTTIYEAPSKPGVFYIGTDGGGLNRFDKDSETFTRIQYDPDNTNSLNGNYITSIYEDVPGRLLIGTRKSGLNWLDVENNTFKHFTAYNSGLPDNYVSCLLGDENGHIWMGTSLGLTRFDPESGSFYSFGTRHGIQAHPFISSCDFDQAGNLIFGGINGFIVFHPDDLKSEMSAFPVVLTNFLLTEQPVGPDIDGPLQTPIWKAQEMRLPHNESTFSFEFAALDYRNPQSNQYTYLLEGYDSDWRDSGTLHRANYTKVPPGEYIFRVRAANSEGAWNLEGASINVIILPPWWRTWWAYGIYGLILVLGIFSVDQFQRRRLIVKERDRARERELQQEKEYNRKLEKAYSELEDSLNKLTAAQDQLVQQEKLASLGQLTAGIAHEIKNPLNFVNNFSGVSIELLEEAFDEIAKLEKSEILDEISAIFTDVKTNLTKIYEHGTRADGIVKSMLLHSRGGDGKMEPTPLNPLIKEYVNLAFHGMRAGKDSINVDIELDLNESVGEIPMVAEDFSRVILNLSNNGFDAMSEKIKFNGQALNSRDYTPKLSVRSSSENGKVTVEIEDNGPGIPEEIRDKILQPFFTTKKGTQGTGLGLSITNDIVQAHGGSLEIHSQPGQTVFTIKLTR